jgi:two-component system, chemotaxis family, protein-glutamate methylesterase/glutaminase
MLAAQTDSVDRALWAALRSLEERAALTRRLADRARHRKHTGVAAAFDRRANAAEEHAAVVRNMLLSRAAGHVVPDHTGNEHVDPIEGTAAVKASPLE